LVEIGPAIKQSVVVFTKPRKKYCNPNRFGQLELWLIFSGRFRGLTPPMNGPSFSSVRGANRPSAGTTKAESFVRNAKDPWNLIQVMLAKGGNDFLPRFPDLATRHPTFDTLL
jgi:hypothetical protein